MGNTVKKQKGLEGATIKKPLYISINQLLYLYIIWNITLKI